MPNTPPITLDDIRSLFPGESDGDLQTRIDGVWGRVQLLVPCYTSDTFPDWKVKYVRSVVLDALKYAAKATASGGGLKKQFNTGPFGVTMETREQAPSTLFTKPQEEALRGLCGPTQTRLAHSVKLGAPDHGS